MVIFVFWDKKVLYRSFGVISFFIGSDFFLVMEY